MEGLGEAIENVGLAQEIQNGLAKSMMKPPAFAKWAEEIEAKKTELAGKSMAELAKDELGLLVVPAWAEATGKSADDESFKTSPAMDVMAKYTIARTKIAQDPVNGKQFEEMRPLGKGAFGAVFLTFKKDTGAPFAVKKCVKTIAKKNHMLKDVLIEREVLAKVKSRFCVELHYAYQDDVTIFLVLTLMPGGDLSFVLHQRYEGTDGGKKGEFNPLPDGCVKFYGASMAAGLQAIHDCGYVYRDLKPQNVLLDAEGLVRISDMGLTADISKGQIKQCSGTRGYWSPETIKKEAYTTEPDWWSLGVTMFVLQSDKMPFHGKTDEEKDAASVAGVIDYKHGEPEDLQKLISDLCSVDMTKRCGAKAGLADIKAHPYFAGFDWAALEAGTMTAKVLPNVNDINAPGKNDIAAFVKPKDVEWTDEDQAKFKTWDMMNEKLWFDEAMFRIRKFNELTKGGGGGGGCCVIA